MRDTFLRPFYNDLLRSFDGVEGGRLSFSSSTRPECLNLPWELLPGADGRFLVSDGRWAIRRSTRRELPASTLSLVAVPLRILFRALAIHFMKTCTLDEVRAAKSQALEVFGRLAQVAGVGITRLNSGYALKVNLVRPPEDGEAALPSEVNGVPVKTEFVGAIRKQG